MTNEVDTYAEWREVPAMGEVVITTIEDSEAAVDNNLPTVSDANVTVGLGALAMMSDSEFSAKIAMLKRGQERVREIQRSLMERGEDYGVVKGIDRPFLHLPGAEKLEKFYGYVTRQETTRFVGDGITSPHLAYRTDSYVHLGDVTGPVVATVSATCNSWEAKYRYVWAKPSCPKCGREGLVKRKSPPQMMGKWNCPTWQGMGGCNAIFEASDPQIQGGKVENTDPWSLDETLMQMAQKRSYVAAVRRATGTSGIFTIDEDSPSVQQQSDQAPPESDDNVTISAVPEGVTASRGGKADQPTAEQLARLGKISKEKDIGPAGIAAAIARLSFGDPALPEGDRPTQGRALLAWINANMTADQMGQLLVTLDTGEVDAANAPAKATN